MSTAPYGSSALGAVDTCARRHRDLHARHLNDVPPGRETREPVETAIVGHRHWTHGQLVTAADPDPHQRSHEDADHRLAALVTHRSRHAARPPDWHLEIAGPVAVLDDDESQRIGGRAIASESTFEVAEFSGRDLIRVCVGQVHEGESTARVGDLAGQILRRNLSALQADDHVRHGRARGAVDHHTADGATWRGRGRRRWRGVCGLWAAASPDRIRKMAAASTSSPVSHGTHHRPKTPGCGRS